MSTGSSVRGAVLRLAVVVVMVALGGCGPAFPTPFTAAEMAHANSGPALAHYLHQPGATAAVCDRGSQGPHFQRASAQDFATLTSALVDDDVPPDLWQRCAMLMLESLPPEDATRLLEAMVRGEHKLLSRGSLERDAREQAKVLALHRILAVPPRGASPRRSAIAGDVAALRVALAKKRLGPLGTRYALDILLGIDLEEGTFRGDKLTIAVLDELHAKKDEAMLARIAGRVPDASLRLEARRRIVRMHIAASPIALVREHAAEVEAAVLESGRYPIDVTRTPPTSAWVDEERLKVRGVVVRQDVWRQTSTLLAYRGKDPSGSVLPSVNLRGSLFVRIPGLDTPITLCAPPEALDVTPCLHAADLHPKVPIVYVDAEGLLHFVEHVASRDAMRLVYNTPNLPLPFEINGRALLTIEWPIVFERPEPLIFSGPASGRGPDLRVKIERRYSPRIVFEVTAPDRKLVGVVEAADLAQFAIASRGGAGAAGSAGTAGANGSQGSAGSSASCPGGMGGMGGTGGAGGNGTPGGHGGPGGPGGDVVTNLACTTGDCASVATVVARMVRSEGGPGGPGGQGGRGGSGGSGGPGGSGASCTDSQGRSHYSPGGSQGSQGPSGSQGANGSPGANGAPGRSELHVAD